MRAAERKRARALELGADEARAPEEVERRAAAVLDLARAGEIVWDVETLALERANEALDRLRRGDVLQRLVLTP